MDPQLVVGAILVDSLSRPTRVLAARRSRPAHLAGRWEFPGGKVEPGETPERALARELREELDIDIVVGPEHPDGLQTIDEHLQLRLFFATISSGEPAAGDSHDEVRWLDASSIHGVPWLDADEPVARSLLSER